MSCVISLAMVVDKLKLVLAVLPNAPNSIPAYMSSVMLTLAEELVERELLSYKPTWYTYSMPSVAVIDFQ